MTQTQKLGRKGWKTYLARPVYCTRKRVGSLLNAKKVSQWQKMGKRTNKFFLFERKKRLTRPGSRVRWMNDKKGTKAAGRGNKAAEAHKPHTPKIGTAKTVIRCKSIVSASWAYKIQGTGRQRMIQIFHRRLKRRMKVVKRGEKRKEHDG
jgi:hypothetical protein